MADDPTESNPLPPSRGDTAQPEAPDLEALLDQAEQLATQAAAQVGADPPLASRKPVDMSDSTDTAAVVEAQLEQVTTLVAEANAEAATWATADESSPTETPAVAESPEAEADTSSESTAPTESAVEPPVAELATTEPETPPSPRPIAAAPVAGDPATEPQPTATPSGPGLLAGAMTLLLWPLNRPFARIGDRPRKIAGLIGIATFLTALAVWLVPILLR